MQTIHVLNKVIGKQHKPFVIAEMSGNHNHSLERALEIVEAAAKAGADALKIQTYTADTMTLDVDSEQFVITDKDSLWYGESLYSLYKKAYTPWEWHKAIFDHCKKFGMIGFSTPFDETAVEFLEGLDVPLYKIASFENIDLPLIEKVSATGKPVIISTGMATAAEIDEAVKTARAAGCKELILLKCTSDYPALPVNSNLKTIPHLSDLFQCQVGLSDHTLGIGAAIASVALGATVIEKHFTLNRNEGGVDAAFSAEPQELHMLIQESERAWQALGDICYGPTQREMASLKFRRSLYIAENVEAGQILTSENLKIRRPGYGLSPKYYHKLLGTKVSRTLSRGTAVTWDLIKD